MNKYWKHGTKEEAEEREMLFNNSKNFRDELASIIEKRRPRHLETHFTDGDWAYRQANHIGINATIDDILNLIK
jgi:hypothetical protein